MFPMQMAELGVEGEGIWLALGTVLMLIGMVVFIAKGWGVEDPQKKEFSRGRVWRSRARPG